MYILLLLLLTLLIFKTLFNSFGVTTTDDRDRAIKDFVKKISFPLPLQKNSQPSRSSRSLAGGV